MNLQLFALNLPEDFKFPPNGEIGDLYRLHSAWYSGDPNTLIEVYKSMVGLSYGTQKESFWARKADNGMVKMHVPLASDIVSTSADLLFSELPEIVIPEAEDGSASDATDAQDRLDKIVEESGLASRLIEAAETCAALGGVFLVPTWDKEITNFPILAVNQADNAIPEFRWGILTAVTFFRTIYSDESYVYRHLERHEKGKIYHGLYKGTKTELGKQVPLDTFEATAGLKPEIDTGFPGLMVRYIPNMKPNRRFRGSPFGQSDYAGIEQLMDSLDEIYSSWMRDIRLARARIIVPESFLDVAETADGKKVPYFDMDQSIFTALSIDPVTAKEAGITMQQFDIRADKHQQSAYELIERIVAHAGYSPQTFGLKTEGKAEAATALNIRERKTYITRQKKWKYWKNALEDVLEMMLFIDSKVLGNATAVFRPTAKLADTMNRDINTLATALQALSAAQAMSIDTKVRWLHPDWSEEQIQAEVKLIMEEQGLTTMPNPDEVGLA